jgi:hypothetical protein
MLNSAKMNLVIVENETSRLADCLEIWCEWMHRDNLRLGYPSQASGGFITSWIKDDDDKYQEADNLTAHAVSAVVESMSRPQKTAVYVSQGLLPRVFNFRVSYEDALGEAMGVLEDGLRRRGVL